MGAIHASLLPDAPEYLRGAGWERKSLTARVAFWKTCKSRMAKLANRIGPDMKRLRMAIHARVPWHMEEGLTRLELLDAQKEEQFWRSLNERKQRMIKRYEAEIKKSRQAIQELEAESVRHVHTALSWLHRVAELSKKQ